MLLAYGGIITALSVIFLFLSSVVSINTLAFLTLTSCLIGIMYIEGGLKYSLLTFFAVSILSFFLPVDRISVLYYFGFFGYYPILKAYIEKIRKLSTELIIKTIFFIIIAFLGVYIISFFTGVKISDRLPWQIVAVGLGLVIHIYDYILSLFFSFYERKLKNKLRR